MALARVLPTIPDNVSMLLQIWLSVVITVIVWSSSKANENKIQTGINQILGIIKETLVQTNTMMMSDLLTLLGKIQSENSRMIEVMDEWKNDKTKEKSILDGQIMFIATELDDLASKLDSFISNGTFSAIHEDLSRIKQLLKSEPEITGSNYDQDPYRIVEQILPQTMKFCKDGKTTD